MSSYVYDNYSGDQYHVDIGDIHPVEAYGYGLPEDQLLAQNYGQPSNLSCGNQNPVNAPMPGYIRGYSNPPFFRQSMDDREAKIYEQMRMLNGDRPSINYYIGGAELAKKENNKRDNDKHDNKKEGFDNNLTIDSNMMFLMFVFVVFLFIINYYVNSLNDIKESLKEIKALLSNR